jgi:hypothetical protein
LAIEECGMQAGEMRLSKMDGAEVSPRIWLVGEPTPIPGTNKLRCLANVDGALALVELSIKFSKSE